MPCSKGKTSGLIVFLKKLQSHELKMNDLNNIYQDYIRKCTAVLDQITCLIYSPDKNFYFFYSFTMKYMKNIILKSDLIILVVREIADLAKWSIYWRINNNTSSIKLICLFRYSNQEGNNWKLFILGLCFSEVRQMSDKFHKEIKNDLLQLPFIW